MTKEEIINFKNEISKNGLYQKSTGLLKDSQFLQFLSNEKGLPTVGTHQSIIEVNGVKKDILLNFDENGLIHSDGSEPAVQILGHWEYWNHGIIIKIVDQSGDVEEFWENGKPIRIEENVLARRKEGTYRI